MRSVLVENTCLPFLLGAQNQDGGWGFHAGSGSRAESTAWALIALTECASSEAHANAASRAAQFLLGAQLPDGSWPSSPQQVQGSWVTSIAALALLGREEASGNVARGLAWLCDELPGETGFWRRLAQRIRARQTVAAQDDSLFGWSWTSGTASWVEPTSYAILLLRAAPAAMLPETAPHRTSTAEAMLYDRMCPGGGWNCGNPMVYGVPGEPQVTSSTWSLLALAGHPERPEVQKSLLWMQDAARSILSPGSLALVLITLDFYDRPTAALADSLTALYGEKEFSWNIAEIAWTVLALCESRNWLPRATSGKA